ncbi:MAG: hypothetical protein QXF82_08445 [Nitrososphaeria archaeon]
MKSASPRSIRHRKMKFAEKLLEWWGANRKDFPWRKTSDPYKILIAELLLRKTTAKQVEMLYEKFLSEYPNIKILSQASRKRLEELLRPLGMQHKRATLLKTVASEIVQEYLGRIPASREQLMKLSGVGLYVANAILCFAYGEDVPLVDTNVVRVFKRVFGLKSRRRRARDDSAFWNFVADALPRGKARNFNLAVIDLAHEVCTPKKPKCSACPLCAFCRYANEAGKIED